MSRVGVFLYQSEEIEESILLSDVLNTLEKETVEVVATGAHPELLSGAGLEYIKQQIETHHLDRVVVGAESPARYERAFQKMAEEARLNPYHLMMVNLRDEVCQVHRGNVEEATLKAVDVLRKAVKRMQMMEDLPKRNVRVEQRVLVIGGGITGITAALAAANSGFGVVLVEKLPTLGGQTVLLSRLYPKMEDAEDEVVPKMLELSQRTDVTILDYSEVAKVSGFLGNFDVHIRRKPRMVNPEIPADWQKGIDACPVEVPDEYQAELKKRKAFYIPFPTAVPRYPLIDPGSCVRFRGEDCKLCQQALPLGAVDYDEKEEVIMERVGAILVCTGLSTFVPRAHTQYRFGMEPDVILPFQMERMLKEAPARGLTRFSDRSPVQAVAFLQDVGAEDTQKGIAYASESPLLVSVKQAIQLKELNPSTEVYIFYPEKRVTTKGYQDFLLRAEREYQIQFVRSKASEVVKEGNRLRVKCLNLATGKLVEQVVDLVVLSTEWIPREDAEELAHTLGIMRDRRGFYLEAHPVTASFISPVEGIFLLGGCVGPKDVAKCLEDAFAAVGSITARFSKGYREAVPYVAELVDEEHCTGCFDCGRVCPYNALDLIPRVGTLFRKVVRVLPDLCTGCGLCLPACTPKVLELKGQTKKMLYAEVANLWA